MELALFSPAIVDLGKASLKRELRGAIHHRQGLKLGLLALLESEEMG